MTINEECDLRSQAIECLGRGDLSALKLLETALSNPNGLSLETIGHDDAVRLRNRFYFVRNQQRRKGITTFDELSFLVRPIGELWIVRRSNPLTLLMEPNYTPKELSQSDIARVYPRH